MMSDADRRRCEQLCYASKRGRHIAPADFKFLERMWKAYPDEYAAIRREVVEQATAEINPLYRSKP